MARTRRRRADEHARSNDRWVVSYADFITLLFAFFTAMYAISSVDEAKYKSVSDALVKAFSSSDAAHERIIKESAFVSTEQTSISEQFKTSLSTDYREIVDAVEQMETGEKVTLVYEKNRVTIRISDSALFASGSGELMESGFELISEVGQVLKKIPNAVRIEGHTDNRPFSTDRYPSNWELSNSRALSILKYLISKQAIAPTRLSATGFGEFRPVASNNSAAGRTQNRRIDIRILGRGYDN